ncbi:PQQ-binding-like beta-propeller repeat protein [Leptolinea tardivitalis]|uniref:outer membrane protein assembly factor BamB family protein n=1 Tax=Leptolinea tardivitalis TaxID=229920 RepID=UPI00078213CF|nr:PQQ-binding-like beta-propeller repeat protein [Leptolinea tardivitalis]GAP21821.1 protein containing PQQ-like domain [Leptolinea tardivitalis]
MSNFSIPSLFCTKCLSYFPHNAPVCPICGFKRETFHQAKPPCTPDWQFTVPGKPAGITVLGEKTLLVGWNRHSEEAVVGQPEGELFSYSLETREKQWSLPLDRPAIGRPYIFGDWILQITGRRSPDPSCLLVLDLNGKLVWSYDFAGPVAPKIVKHNPEWVSLAVSDGTLVGVNPATQKSGQIGRWDNTARLNSPQTFSLQNAIYYLVTGTRPGQLLRIQGNNTSTVFADSEYAYLTDMLITGDQYIYVANEKGQLYAMDISGRQQWVYELNQRSSLSSRIGKLAYYKNRLFFGASDHKMRCLDRMSSQVLWEVELDGTAMVRPQIVNDALLVCGDSHGYSYGFDIQTGVCIWKYSGLNNKDQALTGNLAKKKDRVYFATRCNAKEGDLRGYVWSMPYHGGQHMWAANMLVNQEKYHEAAIQYALQTYWCDPCEQDTDLEKAAQAWEKAHEPEWGARLWIGVGDRKRGVEGFERAALIWRTQDPGRAAYYYLLAAGVLERMNDPIGAEERRRKAEALSMLPVLTSELATTPTLVQNEPGQITLRIKNTGRAAAHNIVVYVGGSLMYADRVRADENQSIAPNSWWDLNLEIVPTQSENQLSVCVEYVDRPERPDPFRNIFSGKIMAKVAPVTIKTGKMIRGKINIKGLGDQPIRLEMDDSTRTEVVIES